MKYSNRTQHIIVKPRIINTKKKQIQNAYQNIINCLSNNLSELQF